MVRQQVVTVHATITDSVTPNMLRSYYVGTTGLRKDIGAEPGTSTSTSSSGASGEVALVFDPSQLAPGRTLRIMQPGDIDSVVALAFEEYYTSPDLLQAMTLENGGGGSRGILGATWEWASTNGLFNQADADRLVDW